MHFPSIPYVMHSFSLRLWYPIPALITLLLSAQFVIQESSRPHLDLPTLSNPGGHVIGGYYITIRLTLDQKAQLWLGNEYLPASSRAERFSEIQERYGLEAPIQIHAHRQLRSAELMGLLEELNQAGFYQYSIAMASSQQKGTHYVDVYAPKVMDCPHCSESILGLKDANILMDLNSLTLRYLGQHIKEWSHAERILMRLYDWDPTQVHVVVVIQDDMPLQELAQKLNKFSWLSENISLLPSHHRLDADRGPEL